MGKTISNSDDIIDSRDVIARIAEIENYLQNAQEQECEEGGDDIRLADFGVRLLEWAEDAESEYQDNALELLALRALAEDGSSYGGDWKDGETLIRDSYFKEYAEQYADDIGAIDSSASWPIACIDWDQAARELQSDYTSIEYDGVTYWIR
jgi:hypothetical protein